MLPSVLNTWGYFYVSFTCHHTGGITGLGDNQSLARLRNADAAGRGEGCSDIPPSGLSDGSAVPATCGAASVRRHDPQNRVVATPACGRRDLGSHLRDGKAEARLWGAAEGTVVGVVGI